MLCHFSENTLNIADLHCNVRPDSKIRACTQRFLNVFAFFFLLAANYFENLGVRRGEQHWR